MLLYYITDRLRFPGGEAAQRQRLLDNIHAAAAAGIDFIQLREKDLSSRDLELLAAEAVAQVRKAATGTRILINSRTDVAVASGADGVHLRAQDVNPAEARTVFHQCGMHQATVAVSCHHPREVELAEACGADLAVFGPVFEKNGDSGQGLAKLEEVAHRDGTPGHRMPVLALGGVSLENAAECLRAGAQGVAGIRLFQQGDLLETVRRLRSIKIPEASPRPPRHPYLPG